MYHKDIQAHFYNSIRSWDFSVSTQNRFEYSQKNLEMAGNRGWVNKLLFGIYRSDRSDIER